jgi:hypothetical protein
MGDLLAPLRPDGLALAVTRCPAHADGLADELDMG